MTGDWLASFEALKSVYVDEAYSNIAINEAVERHKGCSSGFVRTFTKGVIRDSIRLDYIVSKLANKGLKGIKNRTLIVLRMGIYAIDCLDSVPGHAAVDESVKLAKLVSKGSDKFVNAILRRYLRDGVEIPTDDLSLKYSFPKELVELLESQYGEETENLLAALNKAPKIIIRCNTLKCSRDELIARLSEEGVKCEAVADSECAILIHEGNLISSELFTKGYFTIQGLSSIMAIEAFHPHSDSKILDMCAAPGGKTTAMAELANDRARITACDVYEHRLELIEASARRLGLSSIKTALLDGTKFDESHSESYEYVLCDVPCSGLGVIGSKPEIKYRARIDDFEELESIQLSILENAYRYLKPGGKLMYSTCTINKSENDAVVNAFAEHNELAKILEKCTYLPYNNLMGFYYCIIEKNSKCI